MLVYLPSLWSLSSSGIRVMCEKSITSPKNTCDSYSRTLAVAVTIFLATMPLAPSIGSNLYSPVFSEIVLRPETFAYH